MNEHNQEGINEHPNILIQNFLDDCGFYETDNNKTLSNKLNQEELINAKVNQSKPEINNFPRQPSHKKIKNKIFLPRKKNSKTKPKKFRLKKKKNSKRERFSQNSNTINQCNMNVSVYEMIKSMFSYHTNFFPSKNFHEKGLNTIIPKLYVSHKSENSTKTSGNNSFEKVFLETNFTINVLNKFCDFLFQNGYTIVKNFDNNNSSVISEENNVSKFECKKSKEIKNCPHTQRKHYAKNMCNNCYHKQGRAKRAWMCPHDNKPHYAKGRCQLCYLNYYHENKVLNNIVGLTKGTIK